MMQDLLNPSSATEPQTNVVIQAAAGTGKTWLLVGRIIRLLLNGAAPGSILAITFTRKAAAEMQVRLRQRLRVMADTTDAQLQAQLQEIGAPITVETRAHARRLYEQLLTSTHELRATTFHAFCQELLSRFPLEAGVPPNFTLAENTLELEAIAWRLLDRDLSQRTPGIDKAMDELLTHCRGLWNTRAALREFLAKRSDWWSYTEDQPAPVDFAVDQLQTALGVSPSQDPTQSLAEDADFRAKLNSYTTLLSRSVGAKHQTNLALLQQTAAPGIDSQTFFALIKQVFLRTDDEPRAFSVPKAVSQTLGSDAARLMELHNQLLNGVIETLERQRRHQTLARNRAWYTVGVRLLEHYQQAKRERNLLDFNDLEWLAYRLLNQSDHAQWVQYKLDQRIDHLLVDEFQDTNPTQWRLLLPLLQEMVASAPTRPRSLFIVGDEKQSIYRFRRADAKLFSTARAWLAQQAQARAFDQYISWRSSPAIIQFVNHLFANSATADASTPNADFHLTGFRPHETHHIDLWGRVEVLPLITRDDVVVDSAHFRDPLAQPRVIEEDLRHQREGELIAAKISALIGQPIREQQLDRRLRYGDILILLRDRTHVRAYETALRRAQIPYIGADRGTFAEALEVRDMVHLLTLLITPFDDVALASVLRSPIFSATNEDLMTLAQLSKGRSWLESLSMPEMQNSDALARAARQLPVWRALADRIPVHDLLDRIYYATNLPARYGNAAPAHLRQRVAMNLNRLLDLALEVDGGRFPSIARFLSQLEQLTQEDSESQALSDSGDYVRVLTIHAAKGLESPVVFLADSARVGRRDRGMRALIDWPIGAPRPQLFLLTGVKSEIDRVSAEAIALEDNIAAREEANLLYVALTRARQMLFVSGCEPSNLTKAGDTARGWYGFVERRLQQEAALLRTVRHKSNDGELFNVSGSLSFGTEASAPTTQATPPGSPVSIDPALTQPFAATIPTSTTVRPSIAALELADSDGLLSQEIPASVELQARQRGSVIHRMLEWLTTAEDRAAVQKRLWNEFTGTVGAEALTDYWREATAVVDAPAHRALFDPTLYLEAHNEVEILYRAQNKDVVGIIDRLIVRAEEIIIIDYKTNRVARTDLAALAGFYAPQLRLYADGVRRLWPQHTVKAILLFTHRNQQIPLIF